jgi:ion channel-forming bestrophin family protein
LKIALAVIISYRTSSAYERYNEACRYWYTIIHGSRTLARTVWLHVPEISTPVGSSEDERKARTLVEKKTVVNIIQGFAYVTLLSNVRWTSMLTPTDELCGRTELSSVAVKHYLRGELGIEYKDLYDLVKFLPPYATITNVFDDQPGRADIRFMSPTEDLPTSRPPPFSLFARGERNRADSEEGCTENLLPFKDTHKQQHHSLVLRPSRYPVSSHLYIWPFHKITERLTDNGRYTAEHHAARERTELEASERDAVPPQNIPLEITFYISYYIGALQRRGVLDTPTTVVLLNSVNSLVDAFTGLERVRTTPIPYVSTSTSQQLFTN